MRNGRTRSGFTLAELIVAVAMLAFFSTFIVQMFFKADQLTTKARELDMAVVTASELADQWKRESQIMVLPQIMELRGKSEPGQLTKIHFDADFKPCSEEDAVYVAVLTLQEKQEDIHESMLLLRIVICRSEPDDRGPIYILKTGRSRGETDHE